MFLSLLLRKRQSGLLLPFGVKHLYHTLSLTKITEGLSLYALPLTRTYHLSDVKAFQACRLISGVFNDNYIRDNSHNNSAPRYVNAYSFLDNGQKCGLIIPSQPLNLCNNIGLPLKYKTSMRKVHSTSKLDKSQDEDVKPQAESVSVVTEGNTNLSMKEKLKRAVRDYGATIVVFHVTLALSNYGLTYLAVSSGLDLPMYLIKMGLSEELVQSKIMAGASNGIVAYAIYKIFAPVRIVITLSVAPILVRYLRRKGILRNPKSAAN